MVRGSRTGTASTVPVRRLTGARSALTSCRCVHIPTCLRNTHRTHMPGETGTPQITHHTHTRTIRISRHPPRRLTDPTHHTRRRRHDQPALRVTEARRDRTTSGGDPRQDLTDPVQQALRRRLRGIMTIRVWIIQDPPTPDQRINQRPPAHRQLMPHIGQLHSQTPASDTVISQPPRLMTFVLRNDCVHGAGFPPGSRPPARCAPPTGGRLHNVLTRCCHSPPSPQPAHRVSS